MITIKVFLFIFIKFIFLINLTNNFIINSKYEEIEIFFYNETRLTFVFLIFNISIYIFSRNNKI